MANCLDKQNHAASICSVIINIKIYNPKNYLKSKLFVTKITGKDSIIKLDITPNRGDCFSVFGIARELAVINNLHLKDPAFKPIKRKEK